MNAMERKDVGDRQLDALLERLDRLCEEMHTLNRRLDSSEHLLRISRELTTLNESLQALAYAALGQQAPTVHRRRRSSSPGGLAEKAVRRRGAMLVPRQGRRERR